MLVQPPEPFDANSVNCSLVTDDARGSAAHAGPELPPALRAFATLSLGPLSLAMLASRDTKRITSLLSCVVALMIACFATALSGSTLPPGVIAGLLPSIPDGGAELSLAVIGTTAIPVNLLMGSSLARSSTDARTVRASAIHCTQGADAGADAQRCIAREFPDALSHRARAPSSADAPWDRPGVRPLCPHLAARTSRR